MFSKFVCGREGTASLYRSKRARRSGRKLCCKLNSSQHQRTSMGSTAPGERHEGHAVPGARTVNVGMLFPCDIEHNTCGARGTSVLLWLGALLMAKVVCSCNRGAASSQLIQNQQKHMHNPTDGSQPAHNVTAEEQPNCTSVALPIAEVLKRISTTDTQHCTGSHLGIRKSQLISAAHGRQRSCREPMQRSRNCAACIAQPKHHDNGAPRLSAPLLSAPRLSAPRRVCNALSAPRRVCNGLSLSTTPLSTVPLSTASLISTSTMPFCRSRFGPCAWQCGACPSLLRACLRVHFGSLHLS